MGNPVKWQIQTETSPLHDQFKFICKFDWFANDFDLESDLYQCRHHVLFRNVCRHSHIHINMDHSNLPLPFTTNGGH